MRGATLRRTHPMNRRFLNLFAGVFAALLLGGCGDNTALPTAPTPAPVAVAPTAEQPSALLGLGEILGGLPIIGPLLSGDTVIVLQRVAPLPAPITVTRVIGAEGGVVAIPDAGLTVRFPAGAVAAPTPITVTALAGRNVAYEFGPHGMTFAKPVAFVQDLDGTAVNRWNVRYVRLKGGYFRSHTDLLSRLLAIVQELLPATTDPDAMEVRFDIRHFSGYLVAVD